MSAVFFAFLLAAAGSGVIARPDIIPELEAYVRKVGIRRSSVCYDEYLGCFEIGSGTPFWAHTALPQAPEKVAPVFYFYRPTDKANAATFQTIDYFNLEKSVADLQLDASKQLHVVIHGFGNSWPQGWMQDSLAGLQALDQNVILIKWTNGSRSPAYFQAAANTRMMGAMLARVLDAMVKAGKARLSATTLTGHSLGSHVSGFAGERLPGLQRIIGLDPAGPLFGGYPKDIDPKARLDPTDAQYVEALHTNGENTFAGGAGMLLKVGHIDYYPNGGEVQAGCKAGIPGSFPDLFHLNFSAFADDVSCSHTRAHQLFVESLRSYKKPSSCQFTATRCDKPEEWKTGACWDPCASAGACPTFGVDSSQSFGFNGSFAFLTFPDEKLGGFCGSQLKLELSPLVNVRGKVAVTILSPDSAPSEEIILADHAEWINKGDTKLALLPWSFGASAPNKARIVYAKYKSRIPGQSGPDTWNLDRFELQFLDGTKVKVCTAETITTNLITEIDLKATC